MNTRLPLATLVSLLGALAAPVSLLAQPKVEEVVLGPANGPAYGSSVPHLSKTGLHVAVQVSKGSRFAMRVDGVDGPTVDVVLQGFVFSTDGTRHAYLAKVGEDHIVVLDGKEVARARPNRNGQLPFGNVGFSPKGTHFYYQQMMPPESYPHRWVIDGKPGETHASVETPVFSPDETRYFYGTTLADGVTKKLIVDGKDSGFPGQDPQFSPDSKNIITIAHSPTENTLVINGRPGSRAKKILSAHMSTGGLNLLLMGSGRDPSTIQTQFLGTAGKKIEGSDCQIIESLTFSPDGKRYAALCSNHSRKFMFIDGKKHQDYDDINYFTFSADSTKTFYVARSGGKSFVVVNGEESEGYPTMQGISSSSLNPLRLGAGGKRIGFLGNMPMSRDTSIVIDGKTTTVKGGAFLAFSPDASRYAFAAGDPTFPTLYLDGVEQKDVAVIAPNNMPDGSPFSFSPDGKHVAHFGFINPRNDKRGLMVNGKLVDVFTALYQVPAFTPDSNHIFYYRTVPNGPSELCVDGKPAVKFSGIPLPPQLGSQQPLWEMSAEGVYTFLAVADGTLKRFRVTPGTDTSITKMIADVEAAAAKEIADANAAKKKAADDAAALKKKQDDDRAAAAAKAKADNDAAIAKRKADAEALAAKRKADAAAAAAARAAKQKK